jgi:hypothetical protein
VASEEYKEDQSVWVFPRQCSSLSMEREAAVKANEIILEKNLDKKGSTISSNGRSLLIWISKDEHPLKAC